MKKGVIPAIAAVLALLIVKTGALDALVMFLLVGAIPGTNINLPASLMFVILVLAAWFVLFGSAVATTRHFTIKLLGNYLVRKKQLPKRRYRRV